MGERKHWTALTEDNESVSQSIFTHVHYLTVGLTIPSASLSANQPSWLCRKNPPEGLG